MNVTEIREAAIELGALVDTAAVKKRETMTIFVKRGAEVSDMLNRCADVIEPIAENAAIERAEVERLTAQIERLKTLAREGWNTAREIADDEGLEPPERVVAALKEIEVMP